VHLEEYVPLAPHTTLRIGGPARYFARISSESALLEAIDFARSRDLPIFTLGGGSNLVVPDQGFAGLVLHAAIGASILNEEEDNGIFRFVDAGVDWDHFVLNTCEQGIAGVECLAGIPGLVGGAPIQNIGAYGQEVASVIHAVRALDLQTLTFVDIPHAECRFAYRTSRFNSTHRNRYIVTRVDFFFPKDAQPNLAYADLAPIRDTHPSLLDIYHFVRSVRARKGMLIDPANLTPDTRSAGSFFKNPIIPAAILSGIADTLAISESEIPHWPQPTGHSGAHIKLAAAWLIERAGFPKGFALGPAGISSRHTLALVNRTGSATCSDLLALRDHIAAEVLRRFGIRLEQEPILMK
jgi:UDP-N-acetylmuramate dehydrogenase